MFFKVNVSEHFCLLVVTLDNALQNNLYIINQVSLSRLIHLIFFI